ncbi:MAG: hypothetical protein JJU09_09790 [Rhodobacteraceae bacterium]|nr:hypothetical protein [Paracoccaceae bacterium]MCC5966648.1 hypothetical protein [Natronohydrobacter sp.]
MSQLIKDHDFWQHQAPGLALYLSDAGMRAVRLPVAVPELAVADAGFHILPLLPLQQQDAVFLVLTLTAKAAHLWQATRFAMTAVDIPGMPVSIESLDEAPDHESSLQSHGYGRPNTSGKSMPKTQVYGDSPVEWRKGRLVEYARRIASALSTHLTRHPHRIVVVADAEIGGHILKEEALAPLIAGFVEVNPAALGEGAIHAAASAVMKPIHDETLDAALGQLDALIGRGDATACTDPAQLNGAAQDGRVEQLFVAEHQGVSGLPDIRTGPAEGTDPAIRNDQERAAQSTLRNGGVIWVVSPDRLPEGKRMAAVLRY